MAAAPAASSASGPVARSRALRRQAASRHRLPSRPRAALLDVVVLEQLAALSLIAASLTVTGVALSTAARSPQPAATRLLPRPPDALQSALSAMSELSEAWTAPAAAVPSGSAEEPPPEPGSPEEPPSDAAELIWAAAAPGFTVGAAPRGVAALSAGGNVREEPPLPALLLQALSPAPRAALLRAAMAALRCQLAACAPSSSEAAAWEAAAARAVAAAAVAGGASWLDAYPQLQLRPGAGSGEEGRGAALAVLGPGAALLSLMEAAAAEAVQAEQLGGRRLLYGALARSLASGDEPGSLPAGWGERGSQLGGASRTTSGPVPSDARPAAAAVLQDMVVTAAEAAAAAYVAWARGELLPAEGAGSKADGERADGTALSPAQPAAAGSLAARALLQPRLRATRALERFRNERALTALAHRAFGSVREVYEDRQPLWGVDAGGRLQRRELPCSRRAELDALAGWRRSVALALEAADVVGPLLRRAGRMMGEALSFLLVQLIGRSLGLVARGVRQSVASGAGS